MTQTKNIESLVNENKGLIKQYNKLKEEYNILKEEHEKFKKINSLPFELKKNSILEPKYINDLNESNYPPQAF